MLELEQPWLINLYLNQPLQDLFQNQEALRVITFLLHSFIFLIVMLYRKLWSAQYVRFMAYCVATFQNSSYSQRNTNYCAQDDDYFLTACLV